MSKKPTVGITMGDPNGIGPEIAIKVCNSEIIGDLCNVVLIGSQSVFEKANKEFGGKKELNIINTSNFTIKDLTPSMVNEKAGLASLKYIEKGVKMALNKEIDSIVTAPINKEAIHLAGSDYPGHTEILRDLTDSSEAIMLFEGGKFRVALITVHIALGDVPQLITKERVFKYISVCDAELKSKFSIAEPKIVVCGLNPHSGEAGAFGKEEIEHIVPAVREAVKVGIKVEGPLPADTVFYEALKGRWDLVIAMYHDQGLIPFKTVSFDTGVNVTIGLPIVRTSPDHGTAFDIAWKGVANPSSMIEAVKVALNLIK